MITWDEPKRKTNLKKHGIDLNYGCKVWLCGVDGSSFWFGQSGKTPLI